MRKGEHTRERLLDEATWLVNRHGVGATSVTALLLAAGIKKGTLYFHFPGKDDLCLAVLERARVGFLAVLDETLGASDPWAGFCAFLDWVLERHRGKQFVGGCIFGNTALEMGDREGEHAAAVRELFAAWTERLAGVIAAGQQAGCMRRDLTAAELAQMTVASLEGGIMLARLRKAEDPLQACILSLKRFIGTDPERQ